jgi:transposase
VQEFGSWTAGLRRMGEWLKSCGIQTVAMQSTGVYWIALQEILEQYGIEVFLVNARGTKKAEDQADGQAPHRSRQSRDTSTAR